MEGKRAMATTTRFVEHLPSRLLQIAARIDERRHELCLSQV
jgi:hypothetical protein